MSRSNWPRVPLGELLRQVSDSQPVRVEQDYSNFGIYSFGRGLFQKPPISGNTSSATTLYRAHKGDFIYSRLFAFEGAYGLVTEEYDGRFVSNEYPMFICERERLLPEFLATYFKTPSVWEDVAKLSSGMGDRRQRIQPDQFLTHAILLPPLAEQRLLVEHLDALVHKIEEAKILKEETDLQIESMCRSILADSRYGPTKLTPMRELVRLRSPDVEVRKEENYHFAGVYCFGRGVFRGQHKTGMETSYKQLTRLRMNNFLYPKLMAWEGAFAVVPPECDGLVVSTEFPVFEIDQSTVLPEVLDVYFRSPLVWPQLAGVSTGTNVRRRRLNPSDFLNYRMPIPSMAVQQRLRRVRKAIGEVKEIRSSVSVELDSMLPAILNRVFKGDA